MDKQNPLYTLINECHDCYKCVRQCHVKAIKIEDGHASVIPEKCIACGACVKACPRHIIELRKKGVKNRRVYVRCVNKDKGAAAMKACKAACNSLNAARNDVCRNAFEHRKAGTDFASKSRSLVARIFECITRALCPALQVSHFLLHAVHISGSIVKLSSQLIYHCLLSVIGVCCLCNRGLVSVLCILQLV